jgi:hypothetical protein
LPVLAKFSLKAALKTCAISPTLMFTIETPVTPSASVTVSVAT